MSIFDGITNVVGIPTTFGGRSMPASPTAGPQPGGSSATAATPPAAGSRLSSIFQSSFQRNLQTVFDRGLAGEFDDPALAIKEQAALVRLAAARKELAASTAITGGGATDPAGSPPAGDTADGPAALRGASGAPRGASGSPRGAHAAPRAALVPTATAEAAAERDIYEVRLSQSEARLTNISSKLRADYPDAAGLASASTGTWDPATYRPKTKAQAAAFAQRMVIDVTEGAARLEIVKNQLDAARLDARTGPTAAATQLVAKLEADFQRQQAYVQKLAGIVDENANGVMTDAGTDALAGRSIRAASDLQVEELAKELRASGLSEAEITSVVGANEVALEEAATPGGSTRLRQAVDDMTVSFIQKMEQRRAESNRRFEAHRREERTLDDRAQSRRLDRREAQQAAVKRHEAERADLQMYLARLQQRA